MNEEFDEIKSDSQTNVLRFVVIVFVFKKLYVDSQTSFDRPYQSLLIVFCTLNLMRTEVLIEKNLIFSFDSISTLCSFQCSRAQLSFSRKFHMMRNFFILPDSFSFVKYFFQVFSTNFFVSGAVVSDSFYILPNLSIFVNYFFHLF